LGTESEHKERRDNASQVPNRKKTVIQEDIKITKTEQNSTHIKIINILSRKQNKRVNQLYISYALVHRSGNSVKGEKSPASSSSSFICIKIKTCRTERLPFKQH